MRVLLDTHLLLALINEGSVELLPAHRALLEQPDTDPLVSVASLWEIAIKQRLGKLSLLFPLSELPVRLAAVGLSILPVAFEHVLHELDPLPDTRDPFDRLLLAVAGVEKAPLLTVDDKLLAHPLAWRG